MEGILKGMKAYGKFLIHKEQKMKKTTLTFIQAAIFLAAHQASALEEYSVNYLIHGNSCFSTTSGEEAHYAQWGAGAVGTALDVTCPLMLQSDQSPHSINLLIRGYDRSSIDNVSCRISSTNNDGQNEISATASMTDNSQAYLAASTTLSIPGGFDNLSLKCHLPAYTASGYSHLNSINLTAWYYSYPH